MKGLNENGLWKSRYYAVKNRTRNEHKTIKVEGGYKNMSRYEYNTWKNKK